MEPAALMPLTDLRAERGRTRFAVDVTSETIALRATSREPGFPAAPLRVAFAGLALMTPFAMASVVARPMQYVSSAMAAGGAILIALMCGWFDMVERRAFQKRPYVLVRSAVIRRLGEAYREGKSREVSINGRDEGPPKAVILGVCVQTIDRLNGIRTTWTTFPVLLAFQDSVALVTAFSDKRMTDALRFVRVLREAVGLAVDEIYVGTFPRLSNTPGTFLGTVAVVFGELGVYALSCFLLSTEDGGGAWRVEIAVATWLVAHVALQANLLRLVRRDGAQIAAGLLALEGASPISETDFAKA
jgi:hypothetical protein